MRNTPRRLFPVWFRYLHCPAGPVVPGVVVLVPPVVLPPEVTVQLSRIGSEIRGLLTSRGEQLPWLLLSARRAVPVLVKRSIVNVTRDIIRKRQVTIKATVPP